MHRFFEAFTGTALPVEKRIHQACKASDNNTLRILLRQVQPASSQLEYRDVDGMTPLCHAAATGNQAGVELLLNMRANTKATSARREGGTPLHEAVGKANLAMIHLLFYNGQANPFLENSHGEMAYDMAIRKGLTKAVRLFEKRAVQHAWVQVLTPRMMGMVQEWKMHWAVLLTKEPAPAPAGGPPRLRHSQLLLYDSQESLRPRESMYTDGAQMVQTSGDAQRLEWHLVLHRSHTKLLNVRVTKKVDHDGGAKIQRLPLRPCNSSPEAVAYLTGLADSINATYQYTVSGQTGAPPHQARPSAGAGGVSTSPLASGASTCGGGGASCGGRRTSTGAGQAPYAVPVYTAPSGGVPAASPSAPPMPPSYPVYPVPDSGRPSASDMHSDASLAEALQRAELRDAGLDVNTPLHDVAALSTRPSSSSLSTALACETALPPSIPQPTGATASAPSAAAPGAAAPPRDDEELCLFCLEEPRSHGFLHGTEVHRCACGPCAATWFAANKTCPECRRNCTQVLKIF